MAVVEEYTSRKLINKWIWIPSSGDVDYYIVEKTIDGGVTWETLPDAPNQPVDRGGVMYIAYTVESVDDEVYQLRVGAVDANGVEAKKSQVSVALRINRRTATPEFVEE